MMARDTSCASSTKGKASSLIIARIFSDALWRPRISTSLFELIVALRHGW
jgi:hypothetical protein